MNIENEKCVIIINENLPLGKVANTAAILGITLGMKTPGVVGRDVHDGNGNKHTGITKIPVPILKGNQETLYQIRSKLFCEENFDLTVADFTDLAQSCKTYKEFIDKMDKCDENKLSYIGIAICGNNKKINKLTGNLPLLR